jgi:mercuric ion binding protein
MKKIILTALLFSVFFIPTRHALAKEATTVLHVSGMTCSSCPITIRRRLLKIKGVHKAVVKMKTATATVTYEDTEARPSAIAGAITKLGYPAEVKKERK